MSALNYFDAGFTDLVSVIPPDAPLSPSSKIDPSQRGKCPGKKGQSGWYGYAFTKDIPDREEVKRWGRWKANVGLIGTHFPALDIDCEDAGLTRVVSKLAADILGPAPVRTSHEPRSLLVYRTEESFSRIQMSIQYKGQKHLVEVLGKGRQYLIEGKHPSGVDYGWAHELTTPDALTLITREDTIHFFEKLQSFCEGKGMEVKFSEGRKGDEPAPPQESLLAPSHDALSKIVGRVSNPASNGWHEMVQMGYAVKAAAYDRWDDTGLGLFLDWCDKWEGGGSDPELNLKNWESFEPPFRIGWSWLQQQAEDAGGYIAAQDEFEADEDAEPIGDPSTGQITFTDEWALHKILPSIKSKLRYVPINKQWYSWSEHYWARDESLAHERWIRKLLHKLSLRLWDQAASAMGDEAKPYRMAAKKYQSADAISSIIRLARAYISAAPTDFDVDLHMLNTPNGPVDLRTGKITVPSPKDMLSRSVLVAPEEGPAPMWAKFLQDLTGDDRELVRYLQKMIGYTLTGDVSAKTLWFLWGSDTDTGKSTFIRVISTLLLTYADSVDVSVFINAKGSRSESLARLPGVRLVTSTEPAAGHAWDEKRIKAITGGDDIEARALYGHPFVYTPQFKIVIVGNSEPEIKNVDNAMLRRIHIVPVNIRVPLNKQVENLSDILVEEEGPQILAWLIKGCLLWREDGLEPPQVVAERTKEYELSEDTLAEWVDEECDLGEEYEATRQRLYNAWKNWCIRRGEEPGGLKGFKRRVDARFRFRNVRIGDRRLQGYRGIRLKVRVETGTEEFE